jgi:hypothetical protein
MNDDKRAEVYAEFKDLVNMTPKQIETWLGTDESKEVGAKSGGKGESVGHKSGREIIEIKGMEKSDLTDAEYEHMQKVVGYIKRHMKQKPKGEIEDTPWRYSLMNWGHDPMKTH